MAKRSVADCSSTATASASGSMRLTRPVRTLPGPTSMNRPTPRAAMTSTAVTQSTPRVRCSTSSSRHCVAGGQRARVGIGQQRRAAGRGTRRREDLAHPVGGVGHERRVGGDADRQHDGALGAQVLGLLRGAFDRGPLAADHDLAGRVAIGDREDAQRPTGGLQTRQLLVRQADDRGHGAVLRRRLHLLAALAHETHAVGERDHAGGDHGAVLAHRVAGVEGGRGERVARRSSIARR